MPGFVIYGVIAWLFVGFVKIAARIMATAGFLMFFILLVAGRFILHEMEVFWHFEQTATVESYVISWSDHSGANPILDLDHVNWLSLTVKSTYERPFRPTYAACFIHGPVYFDREQSMGDNGGFISKQEASQTDSARYVGERQLVVKLIPASTVAFPYSTKADIHPMDKAARFLPWNPPEPVSKEVMYVLTTPRTRLLPDDVVGGCRFSDEDFHVDSKFGWTSGGDARLTMGLIGDQHVAERSVFAIAAATQDQR